MTLSRLKLRSFFSGLFLFFAVFLACEGMARIAFAWKLPHFEHVRLMVTGKLPPDAAFQNSIGQAYLLYIPAPKFYNENGFQHNEQGYRGTGVSLRKKPGVFRILCLGGSTTYGWGVSRPEEAYPALLEAVVKNRLPASVKGVEVINGGLPYGTTAEMLTHYHFKYHYYQPDLVILEAGGNDAEAFAAPFYHPDYSHWRQPLVLPQTLPTLTRKLMESRLASLFLIPMFYGLHPNRNNLQRPPSEPIAEWYDRKSPDIPAGEIALEYNLETLIDEILKDKAKVLLVPFRPAPHNIYPKPIQQAMILNEDILKNLASKRGLPLSPFPAEIISAQNWVDDCHLNAAGEKEKALHIASYVQKLI